MPLRVERGHLTRQLGTISHELRHCTLDNNGHYVLFAFDYRFQRKFPSTLQDDSNFVQLLLTLTTFLIFKKFERYTVRSSFLS